MSKHLEHELDELEKQLLTLSACVEESIHKSIKAFETRNTDLADEVIAEDQKIDEIEVDLEEECLKILALYQPVAVDLRFIVAALKINNDLERVGDYASNIAKRTKKVAALAPVSLPFDFHDMAEKALAMLRQSLDSFVRMDTRMAHEIRSMDKVVDECNREVERLANKGIKEDPGNEEAYLQIIWVSRSLERVGDHATNIAEDIIYMLEGEIVRHSIKKSHAGG
ncbi:MAG: phosphate signaling complex protein PhoU [Candidatus Pacebacteria bacterium]|nr:phosphate signaling complex protein PhoU [Candidatus Paceibacterota bacterium]